MGELYRRDFLKLSGLGASSLVLPEGLTNFEAKDSKGNFILPVDFRVGNHVLGQSDFHPDKYCLLLGETSEADIWDYYRETGAFEVENPVSAFDTLYYSLKNGGVGALDNEISNHALFLKKFNENGVSLAITDQITYQNVSQENNDKFWEIKKDVSRKTKRYLFAGLGSSAIRFIMKKDMSPAESLGHLLTQTTVFFNVDSVYKNLMPGIEKFVAGELIDTRNKIMAYNVRLVENILSNNLNLREKVLEEGKKALFYYGGAHFRTYFDYQMDKEYLRNVIAQKAEKFVNTFADFLGGNLSDKEKLKLTSEKDILEFFIYQAATYSYPLCTFFNLTEYRVFKGDHSSSHDSPRLILWKELAKAFTSSTKERQIAIGKLMGTLAEEDMKNFSPVMLNSVPQRDAMFHRLSINMVDGPINARTDLKKGLKGIWDFGDKYPVLFASEGVPFVLDIT